MAPRHRPWRHPLGGRGQTPAVTARTYRNLPLVAACAAAGAGFVVLFLLLVLADRGASPRGGSATELYVIALVVAIVLLRGTRLRVRVDEVGVTAFTLVRTQRVGWDDLAGAVADRRGLVLLRASGPPVLVQSLGRSVLARRLRAGAQGPDVAAALNDEVHRRAA